MKKRMYFLPMVVSSALGLLTTSCVNGDYDLSDLDTNIRVAVNDLVIPINLDAIKLDDILDLDDESRIEKINIDGKEVYGVIESGSFNSGNVNISPINIDRPDFDPITADLDVDIASTLKEVPASFDNVPFKELQAYFTELGIDDDTELLHFQIENAESEIKIEAKNVDTSITGVDVIGLNSNFIVSLEFPGVSDFASTYHVNDLKLHLPKGFITTNKNYNKETGTLEYSKIDAGADMKVSVCLDIQGIDMKMAGAEFKNHVLSFSEEVSAEGYIDFSASDINSTATPALLRSLTQVKYICEASFDSDLTVTTFSGGVKYEVDSPKIDPVSLTNLPEILTQSGTELEMTNPQIYVKVKNPIDAKYNVNPLATLSITPNLTNGNGPFAQTLTIHGGDNAFCLAPHKPNNYIIVDGVDYSSAEYKSFANLGKLFVCKNDKGEITIPEILNIDVVPLVEQHVEGFELKDYGEMSGNYAFVIPLALTDNSRICYDKVWEDWDSEDLDNLTVNYGVVSAVVTTDIPLSIASETEAYLLGRDKQGKQVRLKGTAALPANANNYQLSIKLDQGGPISRIYGMELKVRAAGANETLSPTQTIVIKDVKAKVSGYYEKEL